MSMSTVNQCKKSSNAALNARMSVESLVLNCLQAAQESREKEVNPTASSQKFFMTRMLVQDLFTCTKESHVDAVVRRAQKANEEFLDEFGFSPNYPLRIRNAELQIREMIQNGCMHKVDPRVKAIALVRGKSAVVVNSWGHLAKVLLDGYVLTD